MHAIRRSARWLAATGTAALLVVLGWGVGPAAAAGGIEVDYQNPVSAAPPVSHPDTPHCSVTVMRHDFANSYNSPYTGTVAPPAACPGPWNKVVLGWSGSVQGRQYDRLAGVWIGGAEVLRTSTPEPDPDGISWSVEKDVTPFAPLLHSAQPLVVDLGNIVDTTYTGVYHMTLTLTYYQADAAHPAPRAADQVLPLSNGSTTQAGWWSLGAGGSASRSVVFPRNLTSVRMEVYARGGGCDEQWFTAVPSDLAAEYPDYLCGGGPYREVQVAVDGRPAGLAQPYPVVYSGGIVPTLWRPIPAIDQFLTQPYDIDLTPFAGELTDGRPHTVTITPYGSADEWIVDGTLFLDTDHGSEQTTGALTADTLNADPGVTTTETPGSGAASGETDVRVRAERAWHTSGYLLTSHGRVTTTVAQDAHYLNTDAVSSAGQRQVMAQQEYGSTTVTANGRAVRESWSYPITVDSYIPLYTDGNDYRLQATVTQGRILDGPDGWTDDRLSATGVLARSDGTVTAADGSGSEHWTGSTDTGSCYDHLLTADHGYLTQDRVSRC
ncbi:peptide-N4-asparagine amidase [Phaeacidiphilus oryzae]|uniref:peptide-N4-asparagine amidase n=1 Tax=Phaeacidiphilus oryzae TaxID=348818 RepID=UPI00068ED703|nr:peptide-N4-asparagine amidase [Phaeacidiphilus oryzae]